MSDEIMNEDATADTEPPAEPMDTQPTTEIPAEKPMLEVVEGQAVVVDQECFLCVGLPASPPAESKMGLKSMEFHYAHGYADGVSAMIRGEGWHFCERHLKALRAALLDRGINWAPDPQLATRKGIISS